MHVLTLHSCDTPAPRGSNACRALCSRFSKLLFVLCLGLLTIAPGAAQVEQTGQVVTNRLTLPRAGVWLPGAAANSGHWWQPDGGLGGDGGGGAHGLPTLRRACEVAPALAGGRRPPRVGSHRLLGSVP